MKTCHQLDNLSFTDKYSDILDFWLAMKNCHWLFAMVIVSELQIVSDGQVSWKYPPDLCVLAKLVSFV